MTQPQPESQAWPPREGLPRTLQVQPVAEGVYFARGFSNAGWVITDDGVVVIDTAGGPASRLLLEEIRKTTDKPVRYLIYTHGHVDHTLGAQVFDEDGLCRVIAHEMVAERFRKYEKLNEHTNRINALQFHLPIPPDFRPRFRYPDLAYHEHYSFQLGGRNIDLFHGRGETDDATVIHVPDANVVFSGDFLIGVLPNLGNPFKVVRFEREWFETLERVQQIDPAAVCPGHGNRAHLGREQVREVLSHNIEALRYLHDEVCRRLNEGETLDRMVAEVRLPPHLAESPHLRPYYSRLEFAVITIHRRYAGWYDSDPADLIPQPRQEVAAALRGLIGDDEQIVAKARALLDEGRPLLALPVLQVLLRADPDNVAGRRLRTELMQRLFDSDSCLMSRNVWRRFLEEDRAFLATRGGV
ncbi:MAG: MBL fold metallo-hydrolase [Chloroflexi bacterium]|nr:MBL fold metallo-hydrolase [Chloroflexota bacterium]